MLRANQNSFPSETPPSLGGESATEILARIWPEYDPNGHGIMANMMDKVLRRVEQEQGTSLLKQSSWEELGDYIARVEGTVVSQKDLGDLLSLLQGMSPSVEAPTPDMEIPLKEDQEPFQEPHDELDQQDNINNPYIEAEKPIVEIHHPRHHPSAYARPRGAGIRKISLSESTQFRPRISRMLQGSSGEDTDESEHRMSSPGHGSHGTQSGASSSSNSSPTVADSKEWRGNRSNYNNMSLREQSRTEYEGYGLEAEFDSHENMDTVQQAYLTLQKKLKETERELAYQARANEQAREAMMNQEEAEDLKRDLKTLRREILEFKKNEQFKSVQIAELTQQIEQNERTNSTQKNTAAALKKQKEELEDENARMRDSKRQTEESLNQLSLRLASNEAGRRRINADQQAIEELRDRLALEVAKGEAMAQQLELANSENEKLRLTELYGSMHDNLGGESSSSAFDIVQGRTLMSELASIDPKFDAGFEHVDADQSSSRHYFDTTSSDRARRLLQESSTLNLKLKRSSMHNLSQRFRDSGLESTLSKEFKEPPQYTPSTTVNQEEDVNDNDGSAAVIKHRADDVDCALPPELQILEAKETLLNENLGSQGELIGSIEKHFRLKGTHPIAAVGFGVEGIIRPNAALANQQKTERARRRKPHQSRVLTQTDVVNLLNPGANFGSTSAEAVDGPSTKTMSKKESKRMIANVTLVSMYTIVGYVLGLITSVFLVDNAQPGAFNYGRYLSYDADTGVHDMDGGPNRFKVIEILVYWIQNLVWQADAAYVPT